MFSINIFEEKLFIKSALINPLSCNAPQWPVHPVFFFTCLTPDDFTCQWHSQWGSSAA